MIICKYCRAQNDDGSVFCKQCGARLSVTETADMEEKKDNPSYCYSCGEKIGDVKFCPSCGAQIQKSGEQVFLVKDFTNQRIAANLFKGVYNSIGGHLTFYNDYMNFKSHAINFEQVDVNIKYEEIEKTELINFYLNLVQNGLKVTTKAGAEFKFVVWHRQEIKAFLDSKKS